jgi:hypothetical protein
MFYKFLGRLCFYFWIVPMLYRMGTYVFSKLIKLTAKNLDRPNWTVKEELSQVIADRLTKFLYGEQPRDGRVPSRADRLDERFAAHS